MTDRLVTVFGGSGFIGRHLVQRLARTGARVRVAVRNPNLALFLKPMGAVGQIVPVQANLRHAASVRAAVGGADAVVNLVGILTESGRQRFATIHHEGAANVAAACRAAGVGKLVHMSALGADPDSASHYAQSKAAAERVVAEHMPEATIMRPSIVFGPEDDFFNRFAAMARLAPVLPLIGGGHTRFQPVYVGDVADAIMAVLGRADAAGALYELGGPRIYTFRALMEYILKVTGRRRMLVSVPFPLAGLQAFFLQYLPGKLLTVDQVRLLRQDNVVSGAYPGFAALGLEPDTVEAIVPSYLDRFRRAGRFTRVLSV